MDDTTLYNVLYDGLFRKWKDDVEKEQRENYFFAREQEMLKELEAELNEKSRKLLTSYFLAVDDRLDFINYCLKIKTLNFGIKIGMDLQKAFAEFEE